MSKLYKSHRPNPSNTSLAGAVVGKRRVPAKRVERADLEAESKRKNSGGENSQDTPKRPKEIGGPSGPEPTRYGDWEVKGRCIDF